MTNYSKLAASSPMNADAARVTARGDAWEPAVEIKDCMDERPETIEVPENARLNELFIDFTGQQFGRLTVLGMMKKPRQNDKPTSWVCRCRCGSYCTRKSKSLRMASAGSNNFVDRCGRCEYQRKLATGWAPKSIEETHRIKWSRV